MELKLDLNAALRELNDISAQGMAVIDGVNSRLVKNIFAKAFDNLSGGHGDEAGSYPVPVRMGFLRRSLAMLGPGQSKDGFTTEAGEAVIYNTSIYAWAIHEGREDKKTKGRPFLTDAAKDALGLIDKIAQEEMDRRFN
jgi:hypothetical protein